jgi:hypothetical protein
MLAGDNLDGLVDAMAQNFTACTTALVKPKLLAIRCSGAKTDLCLAAQVTALESVALVHRPELRSILAGSGCRRRQRRRSPSVSGRIGEPLFPCTDFQFDIGAR